MNIKLVIFDFDGTIADTRKTIFISKQETMKVLGLNVADEETCASTIVFSSKIGFRKIYPELSEQMLDLCVSTYRKIFDEKKKTIPPTLFPDVAEILALLKEKGILTTIASSRNNASLKEFLDKMNIAHFFPYMLGGEDTAFLKPNPEPVLKTLNDLCYKPEQTLVIGDMPMDVAMGRNAGTFTCGVTYGNSNRKQLLEAGADYVIDRIADLADIIK